MRMPGDKCARCGHTRNQHNRDEGCIVCECEGFETQPVHPAIRHWRIVTVALCLDVWIGMLVPEAMRVLAQR